MFKLTQMAEKVNDNECDSESEYETEIGVATHAEKEKKSQRKRVIFWIVVIIILSFCVGMVAALWPRGNNENMVNQKDAFYTLQDLMKKQKFSEDDHKSFNAAFNVFDTNNDGHLNQTEFINYFQMELDYSNAFETIDADKDNVISYPEAVVYVKEMNKIDSIKQYSLNNMLNAVKSQYGFEYLNESQSSFDTFLEYVAILIYFESFDADSNGYIHHNEYSTIAAKDEFAAYDLDENGQIGHDAFYDILYGDDENSWKGKLIEMFGDEYKGTMNELSSIVITDDMVKNAEIRLCPIQTLRGSTTPSVGYKRRLACEKYCEVVYDTSTGGTILRCGFRCR